jgi:DNA gyrase subunit A
LIADENVVITISHAGYIKRTNLTEYKTQNRGGVGQKAQGLEIKIFRAYVCCDKPSIYDVLYPKKENVSGCVFMKYQGSKQPKVEDSNLINIESDDKVKAFICTQDLKTKTILRTIMIMVTKKGQVKKTSLKYSKPRVNGVVANYQRRR